MPSETIAKGVVEGFLEGGARLGGARISRKRRRRIVDRITELALEQEFADLPGERKLLWVFIQLREDQEIGRDVRKLDHNPNAVPDLITARVSKLKELQVLGKRLGELDLSDLID